MRRRNRVRDGVGASAGATVARGPVVTHEVEHKCTSVQCAVYSDAVAERTISERPIMGHGWGIPKARENATRNSGEGGSLDF